MIIIIVVVVVVVAAAVTPFNRAARNKGEQTVVCAETR